MLVAQPVLGLSRGAAMRLCVSAATQELHSKAATGHGACLAGPQLCLKLGTTTLGMVDCRSGLEGHALHSDCGLCAAT